MKKRFLLATALLGTLGITGVARSFASSPAPRPVAIMRQSQTAPAQESIQSTAAK